MTSTSTGPAATPPRGELVPLPAARGDLVPVPSGPVAPAVGPVAPAVGPSVGTGGVSFPTVSPFAPVQRTDSARVALARARLRGVPAPDVVVFAAPCPGCGRDAEWHEEREDTRLRVSIVCDC